jgi:hypothetical protein
MLDKTHTGQPSEKKKLLRAYVILSASAGISLSAVPVDFIPMGHQKIRLAYLEQLFKIYAD